MRGGEKALRFSGRLDAFARQVLANQAMPADGSMQRRGYL